MTAERNAGFGKRVEHDALTPCSRAEPCPTCAEQNKAFDNQLPPYPDRLVVHLIRQVKAIGAAYKAGGSTLDLLATQAEDVARLSVEIERLRDEVEAFREAIRTGEGPSCEDVCLRECIGVCGA